MVFDKLKKVNDCTFDGILNIQYSCRKILSKRGSLHVSGSVNDWFILACMESFPRDKPVMASIPGDFYRLGL